MSFPNQRIFSREHAGAVTIFSFLLMFSVFRFSMSILTRYKNGLHVATDLTLKYLHRKRGKEAIEDHHSVGVLIHDRWGSYFLYDQCKHQVCGSHLLRDLAFVIDSNNYRWARLMKEVAVRSLVPRHCLFSHHVWAVASCS